MRHPAALLLSLLLLAPAASAAQDAPPAPPAPRTRGELTPPPPPRPGPGSLEPAPAGEPPAAPRADPPPAAGATEEAKRPGGDRVPLLGLMLDGGFPDGFGASLLVRPVQPLRLHAGATYNLLGPGLRVGAAVVPFHFPIVPTGSIEYGHTFEADAGALAGKFGHLTSLEKDLLKRVGYDYLSVQLGVETGSQRSFAWFVRGGFAWVWAKIPGFAEAVQGQNPQFTSTTPKIRVTVPAVNTGFYLFF